MLVARCRKEDRLSGESLDDFCLHGSRTSPDDTDTTNNPVTIVRVVSIRDHDDRGTARLREADNIKMPCRVQGF
jgi:hypothetical protein